jgi:hypothetical protein
MWCVLQAAARAGFHVSNWLLDIVLTMLVHHTFLGFELEVYAPFEYTTDADTRLAARPARMHRAAVSAGLRWRSGECSDRIEPWLRYCCGAGRYTTIYWYLEYLIGLAIKLKRDSAQHAMLLVRMTARQPTGGMAYGSGGQRRPKARRGAAAAAARARVCGDDRHAPRQWQR